MMKTLPSVVSWLIAGSLLSAVAHAAPSVYPTGVTRYDPAKAYNQYVIFSGADKQTHLIDMNGNAVKTWPHAGFPSAIVDPTLVGGERGHVLLQLSDKAPGPLGSAGNGLGNRSVGELDWHGNVIWQWGDKAPGGAAQQFLGGMSVEVDELFDIDVRLGRH